MLRALVHGDEAYDAEGVEDNRHHAVGDELFRELRIQKDESSTVVDRWQRFDYDVVESTAEEEYGNCAGDYGEY